MRQEFKDALVFVARRRHFNPHYSYRRYLYDTCSAIEDPQARAEAIDEVLRLKDDEIQETVISELLYNDDLGVDPE